jgi:hypothetical protein
MLAFVMFSLAVSFAALVVAIVMAVVVFGGREG